MKLERCYFGQEGRAMEEVTKYERFFLPHQYSSFYFFINRYLVYNLRKRGDFLTSFKVVNVESIIR